jgi:hypothetical protein
MVKASAQNPGAALNRRASLQAPMQLTRVYKAIQCDCKPKLPFMLALGEKNLKFVYAGMLCNV